jgi:hypothetical protein
LHPESSAFGDTTINQLFHEVTKIETTAEKESHSGGLRQWERDEGKAMMLSIDHTIC